MTTPPDRPSEPGDGLPDRTPQPVGAGDVPEAADTPAVIPDGTPAPPAGLLPLPPFDPAAVPGERVGNGAGPAHVSGRRRRKGRAADTSGAATVDRDRPAEVQAAADHVALWGQPAPMEGRPRRAWREHVRSRAARLAALDAWMDSLTGPRPTGTPSPAPDMVLDARIRDWLATAEATARGVSLMPAARGARMERAFAFLDEAEVALLRRAPEPYLRGVLPALATHVAAHLPPAHAERVAVERFVKSPTVPISDADRTSLVGAYASAVSAARREHARLRSFRNIVIMTSVALLLLAGGIALVGVQRPAWIPLCFAPQTLEKVVCPTQETALTPQDATTDAAADGAADATGTVASEGTELDDAVARAAQGQDIALVMLLGLAAAAVTGAAALRRIRGTSTPFAVPVALIALKLPTGALTAVVGLLLLSGGFVPGFSALDSSGQILAWALVFGAAQQLVTGLVDKKAQSVLDSVGSTPMTAEKE